MKTILFAVTLFALLMVGCESTTEPTAPAPTPKQLIGSVIVDGVTVELYADHTFVTGYNPVYVKLMRETTVLKDAQVRINPMMDMGMMKHSCPTIQPRLDINAEDMYSGVIIFTMAGTSDQWSLDVNIYDQDADVSYLAQIPVNVAASSDVKVVNSSGGVKTVITLMPATWKVGMNDASFMVHTTTDGFSYSVKGDMMPTLTPTMPSMGHGSSGNVNPEHIDFGVYKGKVNLTMTGDWDLEFGWKEGLSTQKVNFPILVP